MATKAEVLEFINKKKVEDELSRRKKSGEPLINAMEATAINQGPFESAAIGMGRGFKNISDALGFTDSSDFEKEAYKLLSNESSTATTAGEVVGEAAPFLPAGIAAGAIKSALPRVAVSTLVGGSEGGLAVRGRGGNEGEQILGAGIGATIAGGAEAIYPIISRIGGALFRKVTGKESSNIIDSTGKPTPEFQSVLNSTGTTMDDLLETADTLIKGGDPAKVERKAFIESQGLTPTKAQVTRDATDFQNQQEAFKTSGKVRRAIEKQDALIVNKFDDAIAGTGGEAFTTGSPLIDHVINKSTLLDNEISDLYKVARTRAAESGKEIRLVKLKNVLGKSKSDDSITGGVVSSVIGDLESKGIIRGDSLKSISIEDAEKIRIRLNQLHQSTNNFGRAKIREFKDAIDSDVLSQSGDDLYKQGRDAKAKFERDLSRAKVSKFDKNRKSLVRDMLENKIDPNDFANKAVFSKSYRADDLNSLKRYLTTGAKKQKQQGAKAWQDLRAETLEKIRDKAFVGPMDEFGNRAMTAAGMKRVLNSIGKDRLNILFRPKEQKFIKNMTRLSELREPVKGTALGQGPTAQAVSSLAKGFNSNPLLKALYDTLTFDRAGRVVLKAAVEPEKKIINSTARDLVSGMAALTVPTIAGASSERKTPREIYNEIRSGK